MPARTDHPHYELLEVCGRGGMGVVYRARDKRLNRIVALKFLGLNQAEHPNALERFRREAQAIAALNHPNVAVVYEIGEWDEEPFLALEFLPGGTLKERVRGRRLDVDEILRIAGQLGAGLEFTHQRGILHRDIKPANSMFSEQGDLKLVDFGLAKFQQGSDLTRPGAALGTILYMAPEVLNGEPASVASEVYSFGALIFELAAGHPMYSAPSVEALYRKILQEAPAPLWSVRPDLPEFLTQAVAHATARDPRARPGDMTEVLRELRLAPRTHTRSPLELTKTMPYPPPGSRKKRTLAISAVLVALIAAGGSVPWLIHLRPFGAVATQSAQTLVVLPFENLTSDPASQTLTVGLQEIVTSILSRSGAVGSTLLVVPSVEVRRNQVRTISDARKFFNATLALSGTVQRSSNGLQITLALTDARTVRLKDSSLIPIPADGAGLQSMLANSLAALFPAHSTLVTRAHGQTTSNSRAYAQYVQGEGALNNRNYDEGVSYFQKAVDLDPAFALARAKLALAHVRSYLQTKYPVSLAKADAEAHRAAEAGITPDVLLVQALIRDATGDTSGAIALFRDYQRAEPDDVEAYGLLADTLNKAGRPQEAEEAFLSAIRMRPGYWPTYQRLGVFYFGRHQFDKAADRFLTGIGIAPDVPSLHYNLGAVYFSQDRWHEAGIEFEKSLAIRPTALAYSNLGTVRFYEGKYREASQQFEQATKLQPNNAFNWGNLGDALWQLPNERDRARKAFAQAAVLASEQLGLNGADADLRRSYAVSLVKLGRAPEAFAQIERVRQQHPADASVEFYTGRVYACAGNRSEALKALKSAVALGYSVGEIAREPDFAALRSDPVFQQLIGKHPNKDTNKE